MSAPRILVVDDDREMRGYLRDLLVERWTVRVVADGAAALESARTDPPDLVVVDAALPGNGGIELLRALRSDPRTVGVPVVLLSSRAGEEAAVEGFAAGADDFRDEDGSWDPIGEWGIAGGRVYSTAIGAMTLEVYYRFRRLQSGGF